MKYIVDIKGDIEGDYDIVGKYEEKSMPSIQPTHPTPSNTLGALDCVDRQQAIDLVESFYKIDKSVLNIMVFNLKQLPSVQPTTLTEDDKETIRIHLSAFKESLCNQRRWNEAKEYEELISRLLSTPSAQLDVPDTNAGDLISKQDAIETALIFFIEHFGGAFREDDQLMLKKRMEELPSVQMDRDIPIKPIETTDRAWGIPHKQAVCPKCDYYLSHISFLSDYKGKRITYCETCGQAIDWKGWDWDE